MGALSRLAAVNRILRSASEAPVSSLTADGVNDVSVAEAVLDETNLWVQLEGLQCNTTVELRNPTTDGFILLPPDTLRADAVEENADMNVCIRGAGLQTRLFDIDNRTFVFSDPVKIEITIGLPFTDLPTPQQFHVCDAAARIYQMQTRGDADMDRIMAEIAAASRTFARAENIRTADVNINDNTIGRAISKPWASFTLGRRRGI